MKILYFFCFILSYFGVKSQMGQQYTIKINFVDNSIIEKASPFKIIQVNNYCQILLKDSTLLFRSTTLNDNLIKSKLFYEKFDIINVSKDSSQFLVLSSYYSKYSGLGMRTGYQFLYIMEIKDANLNFYKGNIFDARQCYADFNLNKTLIFSAKVNLE